MQADSETTAMQPTRLTLDMAKSDRPPRTPPQTTQGLRLPKRERVRSERLPKRLPRRLPKRTL